MATNQQTVDGNFFVRGTVRFKPHTFAKLKASPKMGETTLVSDATVTSGTVSVGGGSHASLITYTGSVWTTLLNLT